MGLLQEFDFPIIIENDIDYLSSFSKKVDAFISRFDNLPTDESGFFVHLSRFPDKMAYIKTLLKKNKKIIIEAFNNYLNGRVATASKQIENLLAKHKQVLVTPIKKAHAFLGKYFFFSESLNELFLYKGRVGNSYCSYTPIEMSHIPLHLRHIVDTQRFSQPGVPCLYLASNSYIVWRELNCPQYDKLCVSAYQIKCLDRNIIDLTYSFAEDIYLISDSNLVDEDTMSIFAESISVYPLILACSFVCKEEGRKFKSEYVIPQLIMQNITKIDCIGVAYRSNKIVANHNLPATNLAIPVYENVSTKRFGTILNDIGITEPVNLGYFVNDVYKKSSLTFYYSNGIGAATHIFNPDFLHPRSTFTRLVCGPNLNISYDGKLRYIDTSFFAFDEFILFHNRFLCFNPNKETFG